MNILVLHSNLGELRGGGENFSRNLFTAFAKRGHGITAAFAADRRGKYPIPLPPGMEPIPVPIWGPRKFGQVTLSAIGERFFFRDDLRNMWHRVQDAVSWRNSRWQKARFQRRVERKFDGRWDDFDAVYVHGNIPLASAVAQLRPTVLRLPGPVTSECEPLLRSIPAVCANGDALKRIRAFLGDYPIELPIGINAERFTPGPSFIRSTLGWTKQGLRRRIYRSYDPFLRRRIARRRISGARASGPFRQADDDRRRGRDTEYPLRPAGADWRQHNRKPDPTLSVNSKLETAYRKADDSIQKIVDLLAA